jgi:hypothetical protein
MPAPEAFDPVADGRTWPRFFARAAILSPFAAMLIIALARQLERHRSPGVAVMIENVSNSLSATIAVLGFALGIAGMIGGWRRRSHDTMMIAGLGLFVSGGYLVLAIFANVLTALIRNS